MRSKQSVSTAFAGPRLRRLLLTVSGGGVLFAGVASAARDVRLAAAESALAAPIRGVTVYSDRARVVRSAQLNLEADGTRRYVLPLLSTNIDPSSIRLDARAANAQGDIDVERVEIALVEGSELPVTETQKLLDSLDELDDQLARLNEERSAYQSHLDLLGRLTPAAPPTQTLLTGGAKPASLNSSGWAGVFTFLRAAMEKLHGSLSDNAEKSRQLSRKRDQLLTEVRLLGGAQQRSAYKVTATLHGHGAAVLWLSYVTPSARWLPTYDIQLVPGRNQVELGFSGQVSQETGEDWTDVALVLSTAVPAAATQAPKLRTWKLGARERFIPTPPQVSERPPPPPPPLSPHRETTATELLKRRLLERAGLPAGSNDGFRNLPATLDEDVDNDGIVDQLDTKKGKKEKPKVEIKEERLAKSEPAKPDMPPPPPAPMEQAPRYTRHRVMAQSAPVLDSVSVAPGAPARSFEMAGEVASGADESTRNVQIVGVGLAPPPAYRPPPLDGNSPAALAGGYDLSYQSLYKETVRSGKGARRVALFSRSFPVAVQRKVYAALAKEAYLVAEINNPSKQPLPGGQAQLFVGADPAGVATVNLVAPGEAFTLPLGLDRALKPVRNVRVTTVEKGVFSKDEISEYTVTTELSNPHRQPIDVRLLDQLPFAGDKNVEIKLVRSEPPATPDRDTGGLTWRLTVPPGGKIETRFVYTLRRPKGARLYQ